MDDVFWNILLIVWMPILGVWILWDSLDDFPNAARTIVIILVIILATCAITLLYQGDIILGEGGFIVKTARKIRETIDNL